VAGRAKRGGVGCEEQRSGVRSDRGGNRDETGEEPRARMYFRPDGSEPHGPLRIKRHDMTALQTVCPNCGATNRVPEARLLDKPKCGKCHEPLFRGQPAEAGDADFESLLQKEQLPIVADFWAAWCGPCQVMAPVFASAAAAIEPRARFVKVNTELAPRLSQKYGIRNIPTMMIFKQGRPVDMQAGAMPLESLRLWIAKNL
jgi:thioredoxin 2